MVPTSPNPAIARREWLEAAGVGVVALVVRLAFTALQGLPPADPWRHLLLVERLREGLGYTLFDGQPYLWYPPVWHPIAALLPASVHPGWLAALLSAASVAVFRLWLGDRRFGLLPQRATAAAFTLALFGPHVAYTCHFGPEAWALFLLFAALTLAWRAPTGKQTALIALAGLLFGIAVLARMNLALLCLLFVPALGRSPARWAAAGVGGFVPLAWAWWRNARIIADHPFVFTWDGLATPSARFDWLSTLIVQRHPDVAEGLRRLHELVIPYPEWLVAAGQHQWHRLTFLVLGFVAVLLSRRAWLIAPVLLTLAYYLFLDATLSAHFFRLYVALFPLFIAAALMVPGERRLGRPLLAAIAAGCILVGLPDLRPSTLPSAAEIGAPESLLDRPFGNEAPLLVASGFYHPEVLMARFPERRIVGMPLRHADWAAFRAIYPEATEILWHEFHPQRALYERLLADGCSLVAVERNRAGRQFALMRCDRF